MIAAQSPDNYNNSNMVTMGPSPTAASNSTPILSRNSNNANHEINNNDASSKHHLPLPSPATLSQSRRSSMSTATSIDSPQTPLKSKRSDDVLATTTKMASTKRNIEFHTLFRSVPETDHLIDDYGCALQKEILTQGRMYISGSHICFNANIFGWVTNLVIDFTDIVDIEKRTTAIFIPNAILISTTQAKYFFASFLSRDQAYDQITQLWRESQRRASPSSEVTRVGGYDDGLLTDDSMSSLSYDTESSADRDTLLPPPAFCPPPPSDCDNSVYERQNSLATLPSATKHPQLDRRRTASESQLSAKKNMDAKQQSQQRQEQSSNNDVGDEKSTACGCQSNGGHYTHTVMDQLYQGSIENVYSLLANRAFLQKFLTEIEKNTDVDIGPWQKGESVHSERAISYIKPLSNAIGPRSTKCILKEQVHHMDVENYVTQLITTQTPDVPSGSSFCVKTRICIMRAGQGKVRVLVTMIVEFKKSSWLKSTIEKASIDGQINYYKGIDAAIRKYMQSQHQQHQPPLPKHHRRRRRHPSSHHPHEKHQQQHQHHHLHQTKQQGQANKKTYDAVVKSFYAGVSAGTEWVLQNPAPSTQQLMVACMVLLVLINVYIATKMNHVSSKLTNHNSNFQHPYDEPPSLMARTAAANWNWLSQQQEQQESLRPEDQQNESHPMVSGLNRQILEIERMIRQAGQSIDEVSKAVQQQQRMMVQDEWPL
ncbi:hypothetical protein BDB00DRAFT_853952 [Zychaea mexicana]|uniref:uncharacterized protein n=1 Tax=Zychaea mexicana TaxID=64656 RepID=UPI0022FF2E0B|nr:uncharacterized protein BDB00DRAFT_853952 [Zychaea mexicana]KAI9484710.1 hypothetical protein BDB00DRAFT_853952 [Zychaea mexicana]